MYERHFGLKQRPFSIAPDPRYLFMSERHREALAHLLYGVQGGGGFVLLTGDVGAGKTTVCRCFLEQLPERCNVAYIFNPKLTVEELLKTVCAELRIPYQHEGPGVPTVKDYVDALNEFLLRTHAVRQTTVLIIDEAQNLSVRVLEQLRLLTNLETNERKLLQIILIGQPELRAILARPDMQQLAQRVIARYHLEALTEEETAHYVSHRLGVAGLRQANPFDQRAMRRVFRYSRGVPRRINLLCDRALLGAYADSKPTVDRRIIDKAAEEALDAADLGKIRRARYERAALVGIGLAVGATLVGVVGLSLNRGERAAPRAELAANASPAPIALAAAPAAEAGADGLSAGNRGAGAREAGEFRPAHGLCVARRCRQGSVAGAGSRMEHCSGRRRSLRGGGEAAGPLLPHRQRDAGADPAAGSAGRADAARRSQPLCLRDDQRTVERHCDVDHRRRRPDGPARRAGRLLARRVLRPSGGRRRTTRARSWTAAQGPPRNGSHSSSRPRWATPVRSVRGSTTPSCKAGSIASSSRRGCRRTAAPDPSR